LFPPGGKNRMLGVTMLVRGSTSLTKTEKGNLSIAVLVL
jgi:hypothetical protein